MKSYTEKILEYFKNEKVVTSFEVAKQLKVSWNTADRYLTELLIEGKVERVKKKGTTLWIKK